MTPDLDISARLERIETLLQSLLQERTIKEWYSTAEVAKLLSKAEFTVREWCRLRAFAPRRRNAAVAWRANGSSATTS